MLSHAEVLSRLGAWVSPGDVRAILSRLLRVPEAWDQLHDPSFLDSILGPDAEETFSVNDLTHALLQTQVEECTSTDEAQGAPGRVPAEWEKVASESLIQRTFERVVQLSQEFQAYWNTGQVDTALMDIILAAPVAWRSPLACAWDDLNNQEKLLSMLVAHDPDSGGILAANILLANRDAQDAAALLLDATQDHALPALLQTLQQHEPAFAVLLAENLLAEPACQSQSKPLRSIHRELANITAASITGHIPDPSIHLLDQASAEISGQVADAHAMKAHIDQALEIETQARLQAVQNRETPQRRAALATALAAQERHAEALQTLSEAHPSLEEAIVRARILLEGGQDDLALETLQGFAQQVGERDESPLIETLISLLVELGDHKHALLVAKKYARHANKPSSFSNLADLCTMAGDPGCASDLARIAFAMQPESAATRQILAESLEAAGEVQEALIHWQALVEEDAVPKRNVARCALAAGDLALARQISEGILKVDPSDVTARILHGRALSASGLFDAALDELELASQQEPQNADAWIAFAASQQDAGDHEAAGQTLASALQFIPGDPRLLHARALWLQGQGRISEALEAAEKAYNAAPKEGQFQTTFGDLLSSLGHHQRALPILRTAVLCQPGNWKAVLALAKTYEQTGDLSAAQNIFSDLPSDAPGEAHLAAARIALRSAGQEANLDLLQRASGHLKAARAKNMQDPALPYWEARCLELEGETAKAMKGYSEILPHAINTDPDLYLKGLLGVGRTAVAEGKHEIALEALEAARERFPNSAPLLVELSRAQAASGDLPQALQTATAASELNPTDIEAIEQLVRISERMQTWEPALDALRRLVNLKPWDPMAWLTCARNAHKAGVGGETTHALANALQLGRDNPHLLLEASHLAHDIQRSSLSKRLLMKALMGSHHDPQLLQEIAVEAERMGMPDIAAKTYHMLAEYKPEDAEILLRAGQAHWAIGQVPSAVDYWERAHTLQRGTPEIVKALLNAYTVQGKDDAAISLLQTALSNKQADVGLLLEAGEFFRSQGLPKQALEYASEALRSYPNDADVILHFAHCLLACARPDQALQALGSIPEQNRPARWHALFSLAKLGAGDLPGAEAAFEKSRFQQLSQEDRILVSEAASALGHWQDALEILGSQENQKDDSALTLGEINVRIRAAEAETLYRYADAINHAPAPELCGDDAKEAISALFQRLKSSTVRKNQLNWVSLRVSALYDAGQELMHSRSLAIQDPTGRCLEGLALSSLRRGRPQEALRTLALRDDTSIEGPWFDIITGICQMSLGQMNVAQKALEHAHRQPVLRPLVQALQSQIWVAKGNPDQAKALLNEALSEWPEEAAWHARLARLYLEDELDDSALPHLQHAAELQPLNPQVQLDLARTLFRTGHYSQSVPLYEQALENTNVDSEIWREAGAVHLALGQAKKASKLYSHASKLDPDDPQIRVGWARAAMMQGDRKTAAAQVKKARQLAPEDPQVLMAIGEFFASQGKMEEARMAFDEAAERSENPTGVHLARAKLYLQANNAAAAVEELKALAEQNRDAPEVWSALAEAQETTEEFQAALQSITHALQLAPHNPSYRLQLGRLARKTGQLDRALDELSRLERNTPQNTHVQIELGRLYEARRQYQDALQAYRQAALYDPGNSRAPFLTGMVLKHLKDYSGACDMFEQAVELAPHDPESVHQLAAVRALQLVHGGYSKTAVTI